MEVAASSMMWTNNTMMAKPISDFVLSRARNQWIQMPHMEVFLRKAHRCVPRYGLVRTFEIANVSTSCKGVGIFTEFFESLDDELREHGFVAIYIENVLTERFADFFRRRNCIEVHDLGSIPSFFHILNKENGDV